MTKSVFIALVLCSVLLCSCLVKPASNQKTSSQNGGPAAAIADGEKGLTLVDATDGKTTKLDSGAGISYPVLSPRRDMAAYRKSGNLYIASKGGAPVEVSAVMSSDGPKSTGSYRWKDDNTLYYSPKDGGIYAFDIKSKSSKEIVPGPEYYENIAYDGKNNIYAEKYLDYKRDGDEYVADYGVIRHNIDTGKTDLVIKNVPSSADGTSLGMYPVITAISRDGRYLYFWEHPHAGSIAADGVNLAVYDTGTGKYNDYKENLFALAYNDNLSLNPASDDMAALISGGGREMNMNKDLAVFNVKTGESTKFSNEGYVAMTPHYSNDGKNILFSSSPEREEGAGDSTASDWSKPGSQHIYSVDTSTKKIAQITNSEEYFDFAPFYLDGGSEIGFFRYDDDYKLSLWKTNGGKQVKVFGDTQIDDTDRYYGHVNLQAIADVR